MSPGCGISAGGSGRDAVLAEALPVLSEVAVERSFAPGDPVVRAGRRGESVFVVSVGRLKMSRLTPTGRNLILALPGPGDVVGIASAVGREVSPTSVEALLPSTCLEVSVQDLYALLERRPGAAARVLPLLTRGMRECSNCIVESACERVETRFASLFLGLIGDLGEPVAGGILLPLRLSRQELADLGGTTLETAIRVFSRWGKEDLVDTRSDGFLVRDRARLESLAEVG